MRITCVCVYKYIVVSVLKENFEDNKLVNRGYNSKDSAWTKGKGKKNKIKKNKKNKKTMVDKTIHIGNERFSNRNSTIMPRKGKQVLLH